ncbi:MAG: hypothetical protein COT71_03645 [Candidatus Andersenbacteria bacterium CG10_big_fil_rev_8_21_14_0_10_54_11]|uniref:Uncharacterized protein n=1 Tax=Candidatus Andersenbacteria bacterium CG10_big_fil_rev_8_21_14_0_10_54_11 TaxID=1974485 RepID=A0A2M6WYL7_9BACT|nr:MAG: hypothetical protein COT71_03645 [Candidatus Andersenbacteria bacterium CG10_big_fil_rev_8_21_14_0_10_54_11]
MAFTMMEFVAFTAGIDAVIAGVAWMILRMRLRRGLRPSPTARYLAHYLLASVGFLLLTAAAMGWLQGSAQAFALFLSDLLLWLALVLFVLLTAVGRSRSGRGAALVLLLFFAVLGTLYQVAGFAGVHPAFGSAITYVLTNMAPLLMYAVWVPSAVLFFMTAMKTRDAVVRSRSLMFSAGLLLITYSWASRLQLFSAEPSLGVVIVASIIGFTLILGGVVYRAGTPVMVQPRRAGA